VSGTTVPGLGVAAQNPALYDQGGVCAYRGDNCGNCYSITGPLGTRTVQITDCCAGYSGQVSCVADPVAYCDWCADNLNNHFDLDYDSFLTVCGTAGVTAGHCLLSSAVVVSCSS